MLLAHTQTCLQLFSFHLQHLCSCSESSHSPNSAPLLWSAATHNRTDAHVGWTGRQRTLQTNSAQFSWHCNLWVCNTGRFLLIMQSFAWDFISFFFFSFPQDCWLFDPFLYRNIWKSCGTMVSHSVPSKDGNRRKEVSKASVRFWSLLQKGKSRIIQCSYSRFMLS